MSLSTDIEEAQWQAGLRYKPTHVLEREAAEKLDPDDFVQRALSRLTSDFGSHYSDAEITSAASQVTAAWREQGREILMTAGDADALAAGTGNRLFNGGSGFDPSRAAPKSAPAGSFSAQLAAHQKERGL